MAARSLLRRAERFPQHTPNRGAGLERRALESIPNETPRIEIESDGHFSFPSFEPSAWPVNNRVRGSLFRSAPPATRGTAVLMVHGWNAEVMNRTVVPRLARRLARFGMDAAAIELPYHGLRRPLVNGVPFDFISPDVSQVTAAARQSIADLQATLNGLRALGYRRVGLWGCSLGAWLAGLVCCGDCPADFAVLLTPVPRMDRAIRDLDFCAPLRHALRGAETDLGAFNLGGHALRVDRRRLLILAARHDQFVSLQTCRQLARDWGGVETWEVAHGHITILAAPFLANRVIRWIRDVRDSLDDRHVSSA